MNCFVRTYILINVYLPLLIKDNLFMKYQKNISVQHFNGKIPIVDDLNIWRTDTITETTVCCQKDCYIIKKKKNGLRSVVWNKKPRLLCLVPENIIDNLDAHSTGSVIVTENLNVIEGQPLCT